jgi:uncharacterized protein YhfF
MIFQREHREQVRSGEKTMTRRRWDENDQVTAGKTYRATLGGNVEQGMFTKREDCDCFIRVNDVYRERLGDMSESDAAREGDYSLAEFRDVWRDIHGQWNPDEQVWVVAFEYAGDQDPRER